MVNVQKFGQLIACRKGLDKQDRPRSDGFFRVFPISTSTKYLRIWALKPNILFENRKKKVFQILENLPELEPQLDKYIVVSKHHPF